MRPSLKTRQRAALLRLTLVLPVLTLLAVACTGPAVPAPVPATPPPPSPPTISVLAVDPGLDPRAGGGEHTRDWNLAPRSGDLDALAAAVVATPGTVPRVGLWRWAVAEGVPRVDTDLRVPGAVRDVGLAVVAGRAVVAGTTDVGRRAESFARVSDDALTWRTARVRPSSVRLTEATSGGAVPHVAGTSAQGAVVWAQVAGDDVDVVEVVPAAAGTRRTVVDMAASDAFGDQDVVAVVYRETGPDGVVRPMVVTRDGAGVWGSPVLVDGRPRVQVNGIRLRLGGGWTATGAAPLGPETFGALRPAAWTTVDGAAWATIEADLLGDSAWLSGEDEDWVLGKPSESGRVVPLWQQRGRQVVVVMGDDDVAGGAWFGQFQSAPAPVPDVTGVLEYAAGGTPLLFVSGSGYTAVGGWPAPDEPDDDWWSVAELSPVSPRTVVTIADGAGGAPRGQVATRTLTDGGDWWRTAWGATAMRVEGDALLADPLPVAAVAGAAWQEGRDADGRRLFVHAQPEGDLGTRTVTTLAADGGEVSGDLGSGGAGVEDVAHDGARWLLAGADAPSILMTEVDRPVVWTSVDAAAWSRLDLDLGDAREGAAEGVCQEGSLLVGWSGAHDGTTRPRAWRLVGDTASVVDHGLEPAGETSFDACRTQGGTTLVHGQVAGVATLWRVSPTGTFEEVLRAPGGATFEAPVPVDGGWAAWGAVDGDEDSGPVVWWSPDGATWTTLALPTDVPVAEGTVAAEGADVVAVAWGPSGMRAWRVSGLGTSSLGRA
ncbi:hypothetical protein [Cellulomonas phragmiteti]|uniref:Lipoprotein LpqB beta-propeller domain-containing protein n=1 Tax=Cellulomonas phragmiteti TaxID=478780 RepID=A0ABQ4DL44_9CELL|nr:hypothetical protein [Cellulomonas phragmiteti]GIG40060.1 hypothetical protein Cph01nite_18220 [Cellulomonas phragmiteti]